MALTNRHASLDASPSPPPAHQPSLTKRDVRRNRIMDRLQSMIDTFNQNQPQHYRAQLQAVQVDMTLILRADPYDCAPLEDSGEEIRALVEGMLSAGGDDAAQRDYLAMAGKRYGEFASAVNDELERRDADLTALHNNYHSAVAELERLTQQKLHQAEEEHKALSSTIRNRLIASITKKRQHLLRDKEQLDIADSNALLLHPNHFSINNPGSPGGPGQNRKTRHLRHRAGSPSANEIGENGKRKRKVGAMLEDDGNESPAPNNFRSLPPPDALGGGRSPFKDAREKNSYTQYEAPAYSLERIFTDKELAMASATAQQATYRYFHQERPEKQQPQAQDQAASTANGTNVPSVDGEVLPDAPPAAGANAQETEESTAHPTTENGHASPPPTAAPEMERVSSTTTHQVLTRGGARANPLAALSDLATAAAASASAPIRENPFAPVVPSYHAISRSEKSGAPAPPGVGSLDVENDFDMMRRAADPSSIDPASAVADEDEEMDAQPPPSAQEAKEFRQKLLDQALGVPTVSQPYRLPLLDTGPAVVGPRVDRPPWTGFAQPLSTIGETQRLRQAAAGVAGTDINVAAATTGFGGVSAATAAGHGNLVGGGAGGSLAAALRGAAGGEAMSRTTSAGGSEVGGEGVGVGTRGRGRGRVV